MRGSPRPCRRSTRWWPKARSSRVGVAREVHRPRSGTRTASSASSSTGASTRSRRSATSGTRGTCTGRTTPEFEHHVETFGPQATFGYKDFIPKFKAERFDARRVGRAVQGGRARATSCRWRSTTTASRCTTARFTEWCAAKMGPKRDIVGELAEGGAGRGPGVRRVVAPRRALVVLRPGDDVRLGRPRSAVRRPLRPGASIRRRPRRERRRPTQAYPRRLAGPHRRARGQVPAAAHLVRLVDRAARVPRRTCRSFAAYYYNRGAEWGKGVAINYKKHGGESFPDTAGVLDIERGQLAAHSPATSGRPTRRCRRTPGATSTNHDYKTVDSIVDDLVDIVSKNGSLLLNIGPQAGRHDSRAGGERSCARSAAGWR